MFHIFKRKVDIKNNYNPWSLKETFLWIDIKQIKSLNYTAWEISKFKALVKKYRAVNLIPFKDFIEKMEIILMNNQFKPWFSINKALIALDSWKYPVYKKLSVINQKELIDRYLNDVYKKFNFIFDRIDLYKSLHNINIARVLNKYLENYKQVVRWALTWFNWIVSVILQVSIIVLASQLIIYPNIMQQMYKWARSVDRLWFIDQLWLNLFWWLTYITENPTWLVTIIWFIFTAAFILFIIWFIWSVIKIYFLNQANNNKRIIDKVMNEMWYWYLLLKNIKLLEQWEWKTYAYTNFKDFILRSWLESLNRKLTNDKFVSDFSFLFQFFFQFWEIPKWKVFNLSEWFINIIEDALLSYKTSISSSWAFSMKQIYDRFSKYLDWIWKPIFERELQNLLSHFVTIIMVTMTVWVAINMYLSMEQWNSIKALISWM